ncbi:MAG: 3-hydroxylacyl-ACP dehydratase [Deltaproteobacteria bacterium]|nr:MAG: 3-hydroxylacyl-ACP dehydratase [Deltaproteobacteria bacterium]
MSNKAPHWSQFSIRQVLPHQGQMVLVDEVLHYDLEGSIHTGLVVPHWSLFHNEAREVPAFVGLEYMAQTVSAFFGMRRRLAGQPLEVGFLLGTRKMKVNVGSFRSGQQLRVEAQQVYDYNGMSVFDCQLVEASNATGESSSLLQGKVNVYRPDNLETYLQQQAHHES